MKNYIEYVFNGMKFKHELVVDSRALFDTVTTLHKPREYLLRKVAARMRDDFESGDFTGIKWIQGTQNMTDTLTKSSRVLSTKLNMILESGIWDEIIERVMD